MERGAPLGIARNFAQIRGHLRDEADGSRAAQDARCDAAAERGVRRLGHRHRRTFSSSAAQTRQGSSDQRVGVIPAQEQHVVFAEPCFELDEAGAVLARLASRQRAALPPEPNA